MEPIKISIVVPCYNVGKYIRRGLDSIIAQTLQDWEAILVDDGATDDTGKICDEYAAMDKRFHVVHTKNQGVSCARNTGMEYARGELLAFMDPDDWIDAECFCKCFETYKQYDCDIVLFGSRYIYDKKMSEKPHKFCIYEGSEIWKEYTSQLVGFGQNALDGFYAGKNIWALRKTGGVCDEMFRRTLITNNNLKFPKVSIYEDGFFLVEVTYRAKKLVSIPDVFYNYLQRSDSALHSERTAEFTFDYKYKQLEITNRLRSLIKEFDLFDYYIGSHVLTCLKMTLLFSKKIKNYKLFHRYVSHPDVQEAIHKVSVSGAPLKLRIPIGLLKVHCSLLLFIGCWVLNIFGNAGKFIKGNI